MSDHDTVNVLNEVILVAEDEEKGFAEATSLAEDPKLKLLFQEFARQRRAATQELKMEVMALGEEPEHRGTLAGAARRGWTGIKAVMDNNSDVAVLEQLERGEDRAKGAYVRALRARLPTGVMKLLKRQFDMVSGIHNRIRELRDQYRALA